MFIATAIGIAIGLGIGVALMPHPAVFLYLRLRHGRRDAAEYMYAVGVWERPTRRFLDTGDDQ